MQDSVIFRQEFPQHPLWYHPLFVRSDYQTFAQEVLQTLKDTEEPAEVRLRTLAPDIAQQLHLSRIDLTQIIELQGARTNNFIQEINHRIGEIDSRINELMHGSFTFQPAPQTQRLSSDSSLPLANQLPLPPFSRTMASSASADPIFLDPAEVYPYEMNRSSTSVADLWQEWDQGLPNSPSIRALESTYGAQ